MQNKPRKKALVKIIIIGESGVGKTALLHKYVNDVFIEDHKATIGADFLSKEITIDSKIIKIQIWDTAGQERFQSLGTAFYRGSDACVLVYDITDENSFQKIRSWRQKFIAQADIINVDEFPFLMLGNKVDMYDNRRVQTIDGKNYAEDNSMLFYETSAANGTNVDIAICRIVQQASVMEGVPLLCPNLISVLKDYNEDDYKDSDDETQGTDDEQQSNCCSLM